MAFRAALRPRIILPVAAAVSTSTFVFHPQPAFAEEPLANTRKSRKPIYDDPEPPTPPSRTPSTPSSPQDGSSEPPEKQPISTPEPTPTDRLAIQIRHARLTLYGYSLEAEKSLNAFMKRAFALEKDFTQTVASLAPPTESNETVVPGLIYVLVATLAGSIVTRNRGIVLRTAIPLAFGTTAAYAALPITMRNVGELYERYESRYPEIQRVHRQMNEQTTWVWETGKAHTAMTVQRGENLLDEARKKMEDWVRQGK